MLIHEYRVVLPMTVDEYAIAQRFAIAEMSKHETGGGEGIEILTNEHFENLPLLDGKYSAGQYTHKIYHVHSKMPTLIKLIMPKGAVQVYEESWNAYPYSKTILTNPGYMRDAFKLVIESLHYGDTGNQENIFQLPPDVLQKREVTVVDIANDPICSQDYVAAMDPKTFKSEKTGRGPLRGDWMNTVSPVMTCYKMVTVDFRWFGLQRRVENFVQKFERRLFTAFHRQVFCTMDKWYGMTHDELDDFEAETREVLDRERAVGPVRGTKSNLSTQSSVSLV